MALAFCQECGEETLDQLVSCPYCDEPLATSKKNDKANSARLFFFGMAFIGGLGAATLCNMMGYTGWAMGLGMMGIISMVVLILNLQAVR